MRHRKLQRPSSYFWSSLEGTIPPGRVCKPRQSWDVWEKVWGSARGAKKCGKMTPVGRLSEKTFALQQQPEFGVEGHYCPCSSMLRTCSGTSRKEIKTSFSPQVYCCGLNICFPHPLLPPKYIHLEWGGFGDEALGKEAQERLVSPAACEDTASQCHLGSRQKAVTRHCICYWLGLLSLQSWARNIRCPYHVICDGPLNGLT